MAAFAVKGSLQGLCVAASRSGQTPGSSSFLSDGYFCDHLARQSSTVPLMARSTSSERRPTKLKAQGPTWTPQSRNYPCDGQSFESDIDYSNPFAPGIHIDLLNRMSVRSPKLEGTKAVVADQRKRRQRFFQQRTRDFVDGLVQYISSHNESYRYFITASKENANMNMEQGFISSSEQDKILNGLEKIEKDIGERKFKWRNNVDVGTNIIEALFEIVGSPAKTISPYVQKLTVLQIWCYESIDKIITQIEELQLELILLALRNEGLILPCTRSRDKWIVLGDLVLSKLEQMERSVSRLLSCKDKTNSTLLIALPSSNIDDYKNSLSKDSSGQILDSVISFGNTVIGDIAYDLSNLERDLASWMEWYLLMPNHIVTRNRLLMNKAMLDMDKFTTVRSGYSIYDPVEDSSKRFLAVYKLIPEVLKAAKDFVKGSSFNLENIRNFPPAYCFAPGFAGKRAIKEVQQDQRDDRRRLLHWLQHLQCVQKDQ